MRRAGRVVALCLEAVAAAIRPGVTTAELDRIAEETIRSHGAVPAFLHYRPIPDTPPFPASICVMVNEEVAHGIPGPRRLQAGDIVGIDVGAKLDGYCGDGAATYPVGEVAPEAARLIAVTAEALERGVRAARPGARVGDIGHAIQSYVEEQGFSIVRELGGHGIGRTVHEPPQVLNYGRPGTGIELRAGMTLAIEPMVNVGGWRCRTMPDGWTVRTADGSLSATFEHTIAVTARRPEILTLP